MILASMLPYLVLACAVLATIAGGWLAVAPWAWRWGVGFSIVVTILALGILAIGGATVLDVAHHLGWLT